MLRGRAIRWKVSRNATWGRGRGISGWRPRELVYTMVSPRGQRLPGPSWKRQTHGGLAVQVGANAPSLGGQLVLPVYV